MALPGSKRPASVLEDLQENGLGGRGPTAPLRMKVSKSNLFFRMLCEWCMKRAKKYADLDRGLRKISYARLEKKAEATRKYLHMEKLPDGWIQTIKDVHGAVQEPSDIADELPIPCSRQSWTSDDSSVTSSLLASGLNSSQQLRSDSDESPISSTPASIRSQNTPDLNDTNMDDENDGNLLSSSVSTSDSDSDAQSFTLSQATTIGSEDDLVTVTRTVTVMTASDSNENTNSTGFPQSSEVSMADIDKIPDSVIPSSDSISYVANDTSEMEEEEDSNKDKENRENNKYEVPICRWSIKTPYRLCLLLTNDEKGNEVGDYTSASDEEY